MDFSILSNDELADAGKAFFDEVHARADALPTGTFKWMLRERLAKLHIHANRALCMCKDEGAIQPMSGGGPKP